MKATHSLNRTGRSGLTLLIPLGMGALIGLAAVQSGWAAGAHGERAPDTLHIHSSASFDLTDPRSVFGYAAFVVVGEVEERLSQVDDSTRFAVRPIQQLKGSVPDRIIVEQVGFDRQGIRYELEDQPMIEVGDTYLLALTTPSDLNSDVLTVVAGTVSGQRIAAENSEMIAAFQEAVSASIWPENLLDDAEILQEGHDANWTAEHVDAGYDVQSD